MDRYGYYLDKSATIDMPTFSLNDIIKRNGLVVMFSLGFMLQDICGFAYHF
ncbi:hypothetical protein [Pedobacter hiemivivus]|uniref:hypothetical protein n=1 Tax=Pedobacter hiemivivus TaxID=2530454 RepID=UPI0013F15DFF|nr:hypothetical protein [Pedobacter hiemivivus]